jgi:DNA-binding NarL/FixJ family response regulator
MLRNRALLLTAAGDVAAALEMAEEALELTRRLDESVLSAWASMAVARASVMAGRAGRAVEVLADSEEKLSPIPGAWRAIGLESLAATYAELDRGEDAARVAAVAEAHAAALGLPTAIAWARRASATVALHAGDAAKAAELALESAAAAEEAGAVIEAALSRMLAGRALADAGDEERAAAEFEAAAATFETCGALPHRDAAVQALRRLGRRVHRRTRAAAADAEGLDALTEREQQVAALVVDRRTNPEIAAELFLSIKTVESHVRNLFHKLGVSSRTDVARVVDQADRAPAPG